MCGVLCFFRTEYDGSYHREEEQYLDVWQFYSVFPSQSLQSQKLDQTPLLLCPISITQILFTASTELTNLRRGCHR